MHEAKKVRFAVLFSLDSFPYTRLPACIHAHVCVHVYTNRENITVISVSPPWPRDFLRQLSPPYLTLFSLPPYLVPRSFPSPSLSLSFSSSSLCRPSVSSSRGLDEKSEYATIFKWQPRDTLLNALFASPPTSPACLPFLSPTPSLHRPTVDGPFWLPTRQRRARCSVPD